jgi:hypothetical protein
MYRADGRFGVSGFNKSVKRGKFSARAGAVGLDAKGAGSFDTPGPFGASALPFRLDTLDTARVDASHCRVNSLIARQLQVKALSVDLSSVPLAPYQL